ncbi:MAG: response regulator, partial [Deltaproteobacteria bacterium]|nr:response regulator [Deltaproteobacteria bacterium]
MSNKTVLVLEDNELNMKLVVTLLKIGKYQVLEAPDAATGIRLAREHVPDLILMDIQLPDMNGLSATRLIKSDPKTEKIPVVALTAYAMAEDEQAALGAGCDGYLSKPIDTENFLKIITNFMSGNGNEKDRVSTGLKSRILIVDDDAMNVKLLSALLATEYHLSKAYSGAEALEIVREKMPDLILLDIMMPGIDGYEVTRQLKSNTKTRNIPIILVTALGGDEDKAKGIASGADEFLNKPVNQTELKARVKSLLKLKVYQEQLTAHV